MTTAHLGFAIESSQATGAAVDLDRLTASAGKAERAERSLATASKSADTATGQLARATQGAVTATAQFERTVDMVAAAQGRAMVATRANTSAIQAQAIATGAMRMQSRQLAFQLIDIGQSIPLAFQSPIYALQNLGFQIAQIGQLYMGEGGMRAALRDAVSMVGRFAARLGPLIGLAAAFGVGIAGLTHEINRTSKVTVSFGDTALATFQVIRDGIYEMVQPAINAVAPWFATAWEMVVQSTKTAGNFFINTFLVGLDAIKTVATNLPDEVGGAAIGVANRVVASIEGMINHITGNLDSFIARVNSIIGMVNKARDLVGTEHMPTIPGVGGINLGRIGNAPASRLASEMAAFEGRISGTMATDRLGQFGGAISQQAIENAKAKLGEVGDAATKAGKNASDAFLRAAEDAARAAENVRRFWSDTAQGFVGDLRNGLQQGEGLWRSFATAATNALDRIVDKLLGEVMDAVFRVSNPTSGAGGILGSLFGGLFGGGPTNIVPASVAHGGGIVGATAFPSRMMPASLFARAPRLHNGLAPDEFPAILQRGERVTPRGGASGSGEPQRVHVTVGVDVDASGNLRPFVSGVVQEGLRREGPIIAANAVREAKSRRVQGFT